MTIAHRLERVVVVPRNGYVNRLQAWASSAIFGAELDVPVAVCWEPESVAAASASELFSPHRLQTSFISPTELESITGRPRADLPRYLSIDGDVAVLAGHDRGEQVFMDDLVALLATAHPHTLVIIAGGKFHLPGAASSFRLQRQVFYSTLDWSDAIRSGYEAALRDRSDFLGLHVRGTDRSQSAPTPRAIAQALSAMRERFGMSSLFVAADTDQTRQSWHGIATGLGYEPWSTAGVAFDRSQSVAGIGAMIDWVVLGHARALTYSAESSFAEEAAVASGHADDCLPLSASTTRQRLRALARVGTDIITYPARRRAR